MAKPQIHTAPAHKRKVRLHARQDGIERRSNPSKTKVPQISHDDAELYTRQILEDPAHYNKILPLLQGARHSRSPKALCCSSLCKIFCHLHMQHRMSRRSVTTGNEKIVTDWLWNRYGEFKDVLFDSLRAETKAGEIEKTIFILYEMMKAEVNALPNAANPQWIKEGIFHHALVSSIENRSELGLSHIMHSYIEPHIDLHLLLAKSLREIIQSEDHLNQKHTIDRVILILSRISPKLKDFSPENGHQSLFFEQSARPWTAPIDFTPIWASLFRLQLCTVHRRKLLELIPTHIGPVISRPEALLDFLSQCCDQGGTEAILALSGLHYLIQEKGLDYPDLYNRLYGILDDNLLHKKHRSKTMRLLKAYLSSTHLPAALVASFMKRLSRLCLYGPPAAIVVIVPLVYNLVQTHRVCSLMLHRTPAFSSLGHAMASQESDPFDPTEPDPNFTRASESCLWELESLCFHWHPNVATIAKILAEQFLKRSYNLEHFLDHSYQTLLSTEVSKMLTKDPSVEYHMSRAIFSAKDMDGTTAHIWTFGQVKR